MKKVVFFILFFLPFYQQILLASTTRQDSLGGQGRYIIDDSNLWFFPSFITEYGNYFILELESTDGGTNSDTLPPQSATFGGIVISPVTSFYLGLFLSNYKDSYVSTALTESGGIDFLQQAGVTDTILLFPDGETTTSDRKYDLVLGYAKGALSFGITFGYGSSFYEATLSGADPQTPYEPGKYKLSTIKVQPGVSFEINDNLKVDGSFIFANHGLTNSPRGVDLIDSGGGSSYMLILRARYRLLERFSIIPAISFSGSGLDYKINYKVSEGDNTVQSQDQDYRLEGKYSDNLFDIGIGSVYSGIEKVYLFSTLGVSFFNLSSSYLTNIQQDTKDGSSKVLPYFKLGVEGELFPWLIVRGGVVKFVTSSVTNSEVKTNDPNTNTRSDVKRGTSTNILDNTFSYTLGMAIQKGGFVLDFELNPAFLYTGPYYLSGVSYNIFMKASLTYRFK
ncbi:MAG: hypothetical protein D6828_00045 [Nitrospirae bacterium]|nr:MAG: hypothetical protein D6828_00045 [Nitrospirota bacterium]